MKEELFKFQKDKVKELKIKLDEAMGSFQRTHTNQIISFTAPTGSGKTIMMCSLIENVLNGNEDFIENPNFIFIWLSDSPQLNKQSKEKFETKADKLHLNQLVTITEDTFDKEIFDDGRIYFLNTQKLGKNSNLVTTGDKRQFSIWQTIRNTISEKSDRLCFIIDEAHRGMQGKDASTATSIMQKFIKGSDEDNLSPMPVIIGMSATTDRFNKLVEGTTATTQYVRVEVADVRSSGLLKDKIIIEHPKDNNGTNDLAVLEAAVIEWKNKCEHWHQYCYEQHYAYVNPILLIQVLNAKDDVISETNLFDCINKIEEVLNYKFEEGGIVHAFGKDTQESLLSNLKIPYKEPSSINDDRKIKIVFFKETLSTGWDCPRVETMVFFRHASDATYIAQLLGRIVRTPMRMHIEVDETLNDVHLFLPYFNKETVKNIVDEYKKTESEEFPSDIEGQEIGTNNYDILSVKPLHQRKNYAIPGKMSFFELIKNNEIEPTMTTDDNAQDISENDIKNEEKIIDVKNIAKEKIENVIEADNIDREEIIKIINDSSLLTYEVRSIKINNYLNSLFGLAELLTHSGVDENALDNVYDFIVERIYDYIKTLKDNDKYDEELKKVIEFKFESQVYDVFGEKIEDSDIYKFLTSSQNDIEIRFKKADRMFGDDGTGYRYMKKYMTDDDSQINFMADIIMFTNDEKNMVELTNVADTKYHELWDENRRKIVTLNDMDKKKINKILSDGDIVSKHNFRLPETIQIPVDTNGKVCTDHLYINDKGVAKIKLGSWESGVLEEERKKPDFVSWLRNETRKSWSLCIPYKIDATDKPMYPDFLIIRKDATTKFVVDILEPHDSSRVDNLPKAKGLAEYARQNPGVGRIQLIREYKNVTGNKIYKRLDMAKSAIREKVIQATTNDELDHLFDVDGIVE